MARTDTPAPNHTQPAPATFLSTLTIARWQMRQSWRLLFVTGIGILIAVILACSLPLYALIATSAGIRDAFNATDGGPYVTVFSNSQRISIQHINGIDQQLNRLFQSNLGVFVSTPPQFSLQMQALPIQPPTLQQRVMNLIGADTQQAAQHVKLLQGRLPLPKSQNLEIALEQKNATLLHLHVGSIFSVQALRGNVSPAQSYQLNLVLHVVGIFMLPTSNDLYWHGEDFQYVPPPPRSSLPALFKALVSNTTLLTTLNGIDTTPLQYRVDQVTQGSGFDYVASPDLFWYYRLDSTHVDANNLDSMVNGLARVLDSTSGSPVDSFYVLNTQSYGPINTLNGYRDYLSVIRIPATSFWFLLMGMLLYFESVMMGILVDRKSDAIAILRSRGASRRQVFTAFVLQGSALGLAALILGPLVTIIVVRFFAMRALPTHDQSALNILSFEPLQVAGTLLEAALVAVIVSILAIMVAIYAASRQDMLAVRREAARSTRLTLWRRYRLDIAAAIVALVGYGFSLYLTSPGVLSIRARVLALAPLTIAGAVFLVVAATLLFLRGFPWLLRLSAVLAGRSKSAAPMLALAQMARNPRQTLRTTMLLAIATAFTIFALLFNASQAQRNSDVAAFQVGADFSGPIFGSETIADSSIYAHLPGVLNATVGYQSSVTVAANNGSLDAELRAVDADTYAQTAAWNAQDSAQPLSSLMARLISQRPSVSAKLLVPAIVDQPAWDALNLSHNAKFTLTDLANFPGGPVIIHCIAIAEVQHIPTINDTLAYNDTGEPIANGGILLDFKSYETAVTNTNQNLFIPTTEVWVRSINNPAMLAQARAQLTNGPWHLDTPLNDRQAILSTINSDPLFLALNGLLIIGAITALLLALLGNIITSWQNARHRLTSFAVLRALGSNRQQVISVLVWEQGIVYLTSLLLGILFGALLSMLALPALIFSSLGGVGQITNGQFYVMQSVPSIQVVIPISLWITLGILILVCILALLMMVYIVSRPSMSQTLRLNED